MSKRLNSERRKLIEEHLSSGWCLRRIAAALCVVASGVSREVSRHGGAAVYRAGVAQERAARMRAGVGHHRIHHSPPDQGGLGAHTRQPAATPPAHSRADASSAPSPPTTAASSPGTPASHKPPARRSSSPNPTPRNSAEHVKTPAP